MKFYDKYCPSGTPIIIPYFEVYRTDELNYKDYESPLNTYSSNNNSVSSDSSSVGVSSATGSSISGGSSTSGCKSPSKDYIKSVIKNYGPGQGHTTYTGVIKDLYNVSKGYKCKSSSRYTAFAKVINRYYPGLSVSTRNNIISKLNNVGTTHTKQVIVNHGNSSTPKTKSKAQTYHTKLATAVQKYFKKGTSYTTLINRYKSAGRNLGKITSVTKKSSKWLKSGYDYSTVAYAIYTLIIKYSP